MNNLVTLLTVFLGTIILFAICREIVCWYFKINKAIALLERIEENTRQKSATEKSSANE